MGSCGLELRNKTKKELVEICKLNEIKDCSANKKKDDLVKIICNHGIIKASTDRLYMTPPEKRLLMDLEIYPLTELNLLELMYKRGFPFPNDLLNRFKRRGFIFEKENSRGEIVYYPSKKGKTMYMPILKQLMRKKVKKNVMNAFEELGKGMNEYSIGLDFEDPFRDPEQIYAYQGGDSSTLRVPDWEMFGHTHPDRAYPSPSTADIRNMELYYPEFITANGKSIILNVENKQKHDKWKKENQYRDGGTHPVDLGYAQKHYKNGHFLKEYKDLVYDHVGRKIFYNETGVRITPWYPQMDIPMRMDKKQEKKIFDIPRSKLSEWHKKRYASHPRRFEDKTIWD